MKALKFLIVIVCALGFTEISTAAYSSDEKSLRTEPNSYLPFVMLIDDLESPSGHLTAVTKAFGILLGKSPFRPDKAFLVTKSVVYNYLTGNQQKGLSEASSLNSEFNRNNWNIYSLENNPFLLFVPISETSRYAKVFDLDSDMLKHIHPSDDILSIISPKKSDPEFQITSATIAQMTNIFKTKKSGELRSTEETPKLNILVHGHGDILSQSMVGLHASTLRRLLKFFNDRLRVGKVLLVSCSIGGRNREFLLNKQDQDIYTMLTDLHFTLIIGSIDDDWVWIDESTPKAWQHFFDAAGDPSASLSTLLKGLSFTDQTASSPHGVNSLPQVWIPGGYGFQTYNIDEQVTILSSVKVRAYEDDSKPINITSGTRAVLIYPEFIRVPVRVELGTIFSQGHSSASRSVGYKNYPTPIELVWNNLPKFMNTVDDKDYPAINKYTSLPTFLTNIFDLNQLGYPKFISMVRRVGFTNMFDSIELPYTNDTFPVGGVLHFLRDAFIEPTVGEERKAQRIYISNLIGLNDISLTLELSRLLTVFHTRFTIGSANRFIEKILQPYIGSIITLQDVIIDKSKGEISFTLLGKRFYMVLSQSKTQEWYFYLDEAGPNPVKVSRGEPLSKISDVLTKKIGLISHKARMLDQDGVSQE